MEETRERPVVQVRAVAWEDADAVALRARMDQEMSARYADRELPAGVFVVAEDTVVWTGLAIAEDGTAVGHAALRSLHGAVELKRMYVDAGWRGAGVAGALLAAAHGAAAALGHRTVLLQTGDRQPDAVRLYERAGYRRVPIFAPYETVLFSICMELELTDRGAPPRS